MVNKIAVALTILILALIGTLMWASFHYYGKTISQKSEISAANQAKNSAEFTLNAQTQAVNIFNTIAGATLDEQQTNTLDSQTAQTDIKTALSGDACAPVVVPARANDRLLDRYNSVRKGAGNANTSQPAGSVSTLSATE